MNTEHAPDWTGRGSTGGSVMGAPPAPWPPLAFRLPSAGACDLCGSERVAGRYVCAGHAASVDDRASRLRRFSGGRT